MINESNFEKEVVEKFFIETLRYKSVEPSLFNSNLCLIPSVLMEYIYRTNTEACKEVIKKEYKGDEQSFEKDFLIELSTFVYFNYNVAIKISGIKDNLFKFKNQYNFKLFTAVNFNKEDNINSYSIISQAIFNPGNTLIKPDITIFVNGILFSVLELKIPQRSQSAEIHGREQFINNYIKFVQAEIKSTVSNEDEFNKIIANKLKYFHSPVHLISLDPHQGFVLRNIKDFFKETFKLVSKEVNHGLNNLLKNNILNNFYISSVYTKEAGNNNLTDSFLTSLFSKHNIQNEVFYFNYLGRQSSGGKKNFTTTGTSVGSQLFYPRPNQKYGVDKVLSRINELYFYENNSDQMYIDIETNLSNQKIPKEIIEKFIQQEKKRNKIFSILLQYAPGFGKTNIMSWLSLMIKNLYEINNDKKFMFDKIFLVSDRLDLKDQMSKNIENMNIEKELFHEVKTKDGLKKAIKNNSTRVIILNIHKFNSISSILSNSDMASLKNKRVVFIIDEIHRTNSGEYHNEMKSLFEEISDVNTFTNSKKNLIIGLTATPTSNDIERFGEISHQGFATPLDSYTMREAITDGFVLDPLLGLQSFAVVVKLDEELGKDKPSLKSIYENEERIDFISHEIITILTQYTFNRIDNSGKGMLACNSIPAAQLYFDKLTTGLSNYDASVFTVYSGMNHRMYGNYKKDKDIIKAFKNAKNAIMIVVDKLQTGFDDPRLHTLFIDKELSGISAVQTACRVNRTMPKKTECAVIDFSHENKSYFNIIKAFNDYDNEQFSYLNSLTMENNIKNIYSLIIITNYVKKFLPIYKKGEESKFIREYEEFFSILSEDEKKEIYTLFLKYLKLIKEIKPILKIEDKYNDSYLIEVIQDFVNFAKTTAIRINNDVEFYIEAIGHIILSDLPGFDSDVKKPSGASLSVKGLSDEEKLRQQQIFNETSSEITLKIIDFNNKRDILFDLIKNFIGVGNDKIGVRLCLNINFNEIEVDDKNEKDFEKILMSLKRREKELVEEFLLAFNNNFQLLFIDFKNWLIKQRESE